MRARGSARHRRLSDVRAGPNRSGVAVLSSDPFDLARFHAAQDGGGAQAALAELRAGRKTGHWMWFVFPQLVGLGRSPTARRYAIADAAEARAYLADPVLGTRMRECAAALLALPRDTTAPEVFGPVDTLKLRSSMTLFTSVAGDEHVFGDVLARFFDGEPDPATLRLLSG